MWFRRRGRSVAEGQFSPGDIIIVTGAAQGFGRAMAQRFAGMGARLALWDVNRDGAAETASYCQAAGAEARAYHVDLAEAAHIEAASLSVRKDLGVPFGLINNASIYPRSPVLDLEL